MSLLLSAATSAASRVQCGACIELTRKQGPLLYMEEGSGWLLRGAVYDVTRRETFESLGEVWMQEVDMYRCGLPSFRCSCVETGGEGKSGFRVRRGLACLEPGRRMRAAAAQMYPAQRHSERAGWRRVMRGYGRPEIEF